jgi:hypothetical protein
MTEYNDQYVYDRLALHDLVMTYCRAIDRRDYVLLRSLYWDEAVEDAGTTRGTIDERLEYVKKSQAPFDITVHRIFNTLFSIDGDTAQGEHYIEAYHRTPGPNAQEMIAGGRYLDRYEKRNGAWKIIYRVRVADSMQTLPVDEASFKQLIASPTAGRTDGEDLSYQTLSAFPRGKS